MPLQTIDDNALVILDKIKDKLKGRGLAHVTYSEAIRELKRQLDETQRKLADLKAGAK